MRLFEAMTGTPSTWVYYCRCQWQTGEQRGKLALVAEPHYSGT